MSASDLPDLRSLRDFHDPAATEAQFRELLPASKFDLAYHIELLSQIARTHSLRRQFSQAHAILDEAEALLTPEFHRPRIRCLLERGRAFNSANDPKRALPLFESAWHLAQNHQFNFLAADAAHMIAIAHPDPAEQIRWGLKTIELVEGSTDESVKSWLGPLCNNVGWTYHDRGEYAKSLEYLLKAEVSHNRFGDDKAKFIARWSVAKLLRLNRRIGEAADIQNALETEMIARNDPDGFVYEELGELNLSLGMPDAAAVYFGKAYALLKNIDWLAETEPARLERIGKLMVQPPPPPAR